MIDSCKKSLEVKENLVKAKAPPPLGLTPRCSFTRVNAKNIEGLTRKGQGLSPTPLSSRRVRIPEVPLFLTFNIALVRKGMFVTAVLLLWVLRSMHFH